MKIKILIKEIKEDIAGCGRHRRIITDGNNNEFICLYSSLFSILESYLNAEISIEVFQREGTDFILGIYTDN